MPLKIVRNDITKMAVDAIVSASDTALSVGNGVNGSIHRVAGENLTAACAALGGCEVGEAKITDGYALPCRYVIHTVGPQWQGGNGGEKALLASCYRACLRLAKEYGCETLAFPLISTGLHGYPKDLALKVAIDVIGDFLFEQDMLVYIVVFDKAAYRIGEKLFTDIVAYIDDHYVDTHIDRRRERRLTAMPYMCECAARPVEELDEKLKVLDESFSQMLLRKTDECGMTDAQCYKRANIDRKLFSKIRSDVHYKPSKPTVIAFAIALELPLEETKDMLRKAGFALSHSNKFDIIIEYFISKGDYNIFEINEVLFAFDQSLLGIG